MSRLTYKRTNRHGERFDGHLYAYLDGQQIATITRDPGTSRGYFGAYNIGHRHGFGTLRQAKQYLAAKYDKES